MAGYFSRPFDPPSRPSFFGPQPDPDDEDAMSDNASPYWPFFSQDPPWLLGALNSPARYFGSLAPLLTGGPPQVVPISYGTQPRTPDAPSQDDSGGGRGEGPVALNWVEKWGVTPEIRNRAMNAMRGMTGGAFSEDELNKILDQVIDNIPYKDTEPFQSIRMNQSRIELTPEQYGVVSRQLEMLSPDYRDKAKAAFQKARDSGQVTCPQCP